MQKRWILSQIYRDDQGNIWPVAAAYGMRWRCPLWPEDENTGWALVEIYTSPDQINAAKADPYVVVCPDVEDPRPVPQAVIDAYTHMGAEVGMSMKTLLFTLGDREPIFSMPWA